MPMTAPVAAAGPCGTIPRQSSPPWERQPGETPRAFRAFACYRDLGPWRSLDAVGRCLYPGRRPGRKRAATGRLQDWSRHYHWFARAAAWDAELARAAREASADARRRMAERHAATAVRLQAKARRRLERLDAARLSPGAVLRFLVEGAWLERLARGGEPEARDRP